MSLFDNIETPPPPIPAYKLPQRLVEGKHQLRLKKIEQRQTHTRLVIAAEFTVEESETLIVGRAAEHAWFFRMNREEFEIDGNGDVVPTVDPGSMADQYEAARAKEFALAACKSLCLVLDDDEEDLPGAAALVDVLRQLTEGEYAGRALLDVEVVMVETKGPNKRSFPRPSWVGVPTEENLDIAIGYAEVQAFEHLAKGDERASERWMRIARQREQEMLA